MKILYITNSIVGSGGLERVLSIKCNYLCGNLDYEVFIFSMNESKAVPFYEFSPNVKFQSCDVNSNLIKYLFSYVHAIRSVVKNIQPDIISVCDDGLKAFFLPMFLCKRVPIVYERHASIHLNFPRNSSKLKRFFSHFLMQKLGGKFNSFVVLTKGNLLEWNSSNLEVIPNPLGFFTKSKSTSKRKRVIAVGTHSFNKGYDLLLLAWKKVIASFPDWELYIFGKFDEDQTFLNLARELEIESSVYFSPPVVSIEDEYLESSILVLPSRSEGFGMVLIEAMSCGLPCVAFDCPHGPADIITNGEDGILVPAEDYLALAASLQSLMGDEKLRITMGNAARQNVVKYLPESVMPIWDKLFKRILL